MLWCRTACGYMWITRSPSTYPQKSRRRWRAGPRPASVAPMNDYEPIPGEPTATMFQSLEQIRRQTLQRCTATVGQSDRQLLFGMTTALELQGVPVPSHCNLDTAALHVTVRTRSGRPHIHPSRSLSTSGAIALHNHSSTYRMACTHCTCFMCGRSCPHIFRQRIWLCSEIPFSRCWCAMARRTRTNCIWSCNVS